LWRVLVEEEERWQAGEGGLPIGFLVE